MQVRIPYTFTTQVVPPRCRKARAQAQEAHITLTVREVTLDQAPVAFREHTKTWDSGAEAYVPTTVEYRWFGKRLWIRDRFRRSCQDPYETQTTEAFQADPYPYRLDQASAFPDYLTYASQAENRQRLMAWARGILFIGGERWTEAEEPRYIVMTFGLGHNHGIGWGTSLSTDTGYNANIPRDRYYRIDQYPAAVQAATEIATRRGDTKALPIEGQEPARFEILIPEAVRLRPRREHGKGCAFINRCEALIEGSASVLEAGIQVLASACRPEPPADEEPRYALTPAGLRLLASLGHA